MGVGGGLWVGVWGWVEWVGGCVGTGGVGGRVCGDGRSGWEGVWERKTRVGGTLVTAEVPGMSSEIRRNNTSAL